VKDLYQMLVEEAAGSKKPNFKPSPADKRKVAAIIANKKLPDKAEPGKTYRVLWADGRATWNVGSKSALRAWADKNASEIVWIRYEDKDKK
jgi:predicted alpha/beta superfamily hydrolase